VLAHSVWNSYLTFDQRLAALGVIFTAGAFSLAVVGSVVALLAYTIAIQRPISVGCSEVDAEPSLQGATR
jgi:hypothetical protein